MSSTTTGQGSAGNVIAAICSLFIPGLGPGARYKYELIGLDGTLLPLKADPCAAQAEHPPATASVVPEPLPPHPRIPVATLRADAPVSIYEVHLGSWMRGEGGRALSWDEMAERLVPYARDLGFTAASNPARVRTGR